MNFTNIFCIGFIMNHPVKGQWLNWNWMREKILGHIALNLYILAFLILVLIFNWQFYNYSKYLDYSLEEVLIA